MLHHHHRVRRVQHGVHVGVAGGAGREALLAPGVEGDPVLAVDQLLQEGGEAGGEAEGLVEADAGEGAGAQEVEHGAVDLAVYHGPAGLLVPGHGHDGGHLAVVADDDGPPFGAQEGAGEEGLGDVHLRGLVQHHQVEGALVPGDVPPAFRAVLLEGVEPAGGGAEDEPGGGQEGLDLLPADVGIEGLDRRRSPRAFRAGAPLGRFFPAGAPGLDQAEVGEGLGEGRVGGVAAQAGQLLGHAGEDDLDGVVGLAADGDAVAGGAGEAGGGEVGQHRPAQGVALATAGGALDQEHRPAGLNGPAGLNAAHAGDRFPLAGRRSGGPGGALHGVDRLQQGFR